MDHQYSQPNISDSVIYYATAHEVWEDLRERFSQSNAPRIFEIQRDIAYHKQDQLSVSTYYTKLKGLWDELASYSDATYGAQHDQQKLMQFLMGLNESYSAVRGQILLMNPLPSVRQAYSAVSQEEKQRLLSTHTMPDQGGSAAMAVRTGSKPHQYAAAARPSNVPQENRRYDHDKRRAGSFRGRPQCTHCGDMGHFIEKCYQLHGYPQGHPKARQNSNRFRNNPAANSVSEGHSKEVDKQVMATISEAQLQQLLSLLNDKNVATNPQAHTAISKPGLSKVDTCNWIIDSGATDHISSSPKLFLHKNKNFSLPPVLLPSGETANIAAKGSLPLNSIYYLRDVLCVPTFKVDLLSVSRLTRNLNCSVTFFPYWCVLQDLVTRRTIGLGKQRDGLYYLVALATRKTVHSPPSSSQIHTSPACNLTTSSTHLWHNRLGHLSSSRLGFIAKNLLHISIQNNNDCHVCPMAKQCRLPFSSSSISSVRAFDIIHCDI